MIRRKTNRRHVTGDHHGRTPRRATLQVAAADEILGTHKTRSGLTMRPVVALPTGPTTSVAYLVPAGTGAANPGSGGPRCLSSRYGCN